MIGDLSIYLKKGSLTGALTTKAGWLLPVQENSLVDLDKQLGIKIK